MGVCTGDCGEVSLNVADTKDCGVLRVVTEGAHFNSPLWQCGILEGSQGPIDSGKNFTSH